MRCIDDCDASLYYADKLSSHDDSSRYVLYERKGKCFSALGNKKHAKVNFDLAIEAADKANVPEKLLEAFKRQTNDAIIKLDNISFNIVFIPLSTDT